jgi:hypothetical protein
VLASPAAVAGAERPGPTAAVDTTPVRSDERDIESVLDRYQGAFNTLDVAAAQRVWPTLDARALERAFRQLEEQEIAFSGCEIEVDGARAAATCRGTARYVPVVGRRGSPAAARQWRFSLSKGDAGWVIARVETR